MSWPERHFDFFFLLHRAMVVSDDQGSSKSPGISYPGVGNTVRVPNWSSPRPHCCWQSDRSDRGWRLEVGVDGNYFLFLRSLQRLTSFSLPCNLRALADFSFHHYFVCKHMTKASAFLCKEWRSRCFCEMLAWFIKLFCVIKGNKQKQQLQQTKCHPWNMEIMGVECYDEQ